MAGSAEPINFDLIETQKENIQSLPSGRSAKALVAAFSPLSGKYSSPSLDDTQTINDQTRKEYEKELEAINESDDPLDVYDRYVKWTLDAYPTAQATPKSGLLPLLERATRAFLPSNHYKNDPRYLRLWLHYIRLFSDSPRETFAFLSRHGIGENLALFYEEFASWLEGAGRYGQAEEVYRMGMEKEARPGERLLRKFGEFQHRMEQRPKASNEPSSPALPTVRPALAAKVDPFAHTQPESQNPQEGSRARGTKTKSGKQKMAIFNDADAPTIEPGPAPGPAKGWDNIGSIQERKKENTVEPRPWAGETLKAGKKPRPADKMAVFRDPNSISNNVQENFLQKERVNPRSGKSERVYVNLAAIYPEPENPMSEMSLEELMASRRGLLHKDWSKPRKEALKEVSGNKCRQPSARVSKESSVLDSEEAAKENIEVFRDVKEARSKKLKVKEIRGETQTVKTKLDSPTGPKLKRKSTAEPTMTFHTRAATDEIYSIFNQPLKAELQEADGFESVYGSDEEGDYTSGGESTATGQISVPNSEFGDEETGIFERTQDELEGGLTEEQTKGDASEWTEFNTAEHLTQLQSGSKDNTHDSGSIRNAPCSSQGGAEGSSYHNHSDEDENLVSLSPPSETDVNKFVPIQPEDYHPLTGPYRDPFVIAQNKLPFMTPILEKTEASLASTFRKEKGQLSTKTPSKMGRGTFVPVTPAIPEVDDLLLSSPFQDYTQANDTVFEYTRDFGSPSKVENAFKTSSPKSPIFRRNGTMIITEPLCNPTDPAIREKVMRMMQPGLRSYPGYHDHRPDVGGNSTDIRKYFKALLKSSRINGCTLELPVPPVLCFSGAARSYAIKKELGEGGCAPVYLVESVDSPDTLSDSDDESEFHGDSPRTPSPRGKVIKTMRNADRGELEAIKVEANPSSAWEFYMLRTAQLRLGIYPSYRRATQSIVQVHELHHFKDETILVEDYCTNGTLLDVINSKAGCAVAAGTSEPGLDEAVSMFFAIELFRTVEALHACGIIHGDLKADNCLVRFDEATGIPMSLMDTDLDNADYSPSGAHSWGRKGLTIIDFGRGIDMHAFIPDVQFIADWKVASHECTEMKECRPWTYQVDLYGLAGIIYNMLFGKDMEVIASNTDGRNGTRPSFGSRRAYKIKESLKRYWEREIWADVFDLCLNPTNEHWIQLEGAASNDAAKARNGPALPVVNSMRVVRERMEKWLAANAARKGLQNKLNKLEASIAKRRTHRRVVDRE